MKWQFLIPLNASCIDYLFAINLFQVQLAGYSLLKFTDMVFSYDVNRSRYYETFDKVISYTFIYALTI